VLGMAGLPADAALVLALRRWRLGRQGQRTLTY
jgi:hypothetical protein